MSKVLIAVLSASCLLLAIPSMAEDRFTQSDAYRLNGAEADVALISAGTLGLASAAARGDINTNTAVLNMTTAAAVDLKKQDALIDKLVKKITDAGYFDKRATFAPVKDLPEMLYKPDVTIEVRNELESKSTMVTLNPKSPAEMAEKLKGLVRQYGAVVQDHANLDFYTRGRFLLSKGLKAAAILSTGVAVERIGAAVYHAAQDPGSDVCGPVDCQKPSVLKRVLDGSANTAYEKNRESADDKANAESHPAQ